MWHDDDDEEEKKIKKEFLLLFFFFFIQKKCFCKTVYLNRKYYYLYCTYIYYKLYKINNYLYLNI